MKFILQIYEDYKHKLMIDGIEGKVLRAFLADWRCPNCHELGEAFDLHYRWTCCLNCNEYHAKSTVDSVFPEGRPERPLPSMLCEDTGDIYSYRMILPNTIEPYFPEDRSLTREDQDTFDQMKSTAPDRGY